MLTEAIGPVHRKSFSVNAASATTIVAADAQGRAIRVLAMVLSNNHASNAVVATVQDNTGTPLVLIGPLQLTAGNPSVVLPFNGGGWGEGGKGKTIDVLLDGTEVVAGAITYQYIGSRSPS